MASSCFTPSVGLSLPQVGMGVTGFPPGSPPYVLKPGAQFSVVVAVISRSPVLEGPLEVVGGALAFSLVSTTGSARQNLVDNGAFVKTLFPGDAALVKAKLTVPSDTLDGTYYLGICLVMSLLFTECHTLDGPSDRPITVENGPDLVITAIGKSS